MNITDFNTNFSVRVVDYNDATSNIKVHFRVQCIPNGRVSIHIASVDIATMNEGWTKQDVITAAWTSITSIVNAWASFNIVEDRLTELTSATTT